MKIEIKRYEDSRAAESQCMERYKDLKRKGQYHDALKLLDYIECSCYNIVRKFLPYLVVNKERSIIYGKLKQKELAMYYKVLSEVGGMLNSAYNSITGDYMIKEYYFTDKFIHFDNDNINNAVKKYVEWFKPVYNELFSALNEIKTEMNSTYLSYNYQFSRDFEIYIYLKNTKLAFILRKIDENPFENYIKQYFDIASKQPSIKFP